MKLFQGYWVPFLSPLFSHTHKDQSSGVGQQYPNANTQGKIIGEGFRSHDLKINVTTVVLQSVY